MTLNEETALLMWSLLSDLIRRPSEAHTVVVMDANEVGRSRRYQVRPARMVTMWGGSLLLSGLLVASLVVFTPLRTFIPGYGTKEVRQEARLNAIRVSALQDSVAMQRQYIQRLQQLMTGQVDSLAGQPGPTSNVSTPLPDPPPGQAGSSSSAGGSADQGQPGLSPQMGTNVFESAEAGAALAFPVEPPVESGFPTRDFDARDGHHGVDIAVSEGVFVRSIGEGYIVLADWTRDGGYTVAVQHGNGYLSVYKHNKRLLKQVGDRVKARDALAVSGNSGEMTTGPHLHFELWRHGLAQDPRSYITGW